MEKDIKRTSKWLKKYCDNLGFDGYVIGLSGGIDSAVSMALAVKSMGADRVLGVILPCTKTNEKVRLEDIEDAQLLAKSFGVKTATIYLNDAVMCINPQVDSWVNELGREIKSDLVSSNIKARLRMTTLRAFAEANHMLVLGTTNKTEEYLGYYTKAGDGGAGVDVEPLVDFFKFEIFEMARQIEVDGNKIPQKIIDRKPSAGLFDNQTDESEIGHTYKDIDDYLVFRENITKSLGINEIYQNLLEIISDLAPIKEFEVKPEVAKTVERMIVAGQHKRVNPPSFIR
jgi:NAD+ synthase